LSNSLIQLETSTCSCRLSTERAAPPPPSLRLLLLAPPVRMPLAEVAPSPLAAPAVIMNLVRPLVQAWENMDEDE
jgi:hypothetical protein